MFYLFIKYLLYLTNLVVACLVSMEGPFESISLFPSQTISSCLGDGGNEKDLDVQPYHPLYLHNIFENDHQVAQYNRHSTLLSLLIDPLSLSLVKVDEFDNECLIDATEIHQVNQKIISIFPSSRSSPSFRFSHINNLVDHFESNNLIFYYGAVKHLKEIYEKFFPFILFYIETASMIQFDDPDWQCIIMLRKKDYAPIGLCSYYYFRGLGMHRIRLSQFIILPWFQQCGFGIQLYNTFYQHVVQKSTAHEFTGN